MIYYVFIKYPNFSTHKCKQRRVSRLKSLNVAFVLHVLNLCTATCKEDESYCLLGCVLFGRKMSSHANLKLETSGSSETSVRFHWKTRRHITGGSTNIYCCKHRIFYTNITYTGSNNRRKVVQLQSIVT